MTERTANLNPYPAETRNQLWPLCCGAAIISGFKGAVTAEALDGAIADVPYNQVYRSETRKPELLFVCLNNDQMAHKPEKLLLERGFVPFMSARNTTYGKGPDNLFFFVRHPSKVTFSVNQGDLEFKAIGKAA